MSAAMFLRARSLEGVPHGFSTRIGGVSGEPWSSLNLGRATEDRPEAVEENHRRLAAAAGFPVEALRTPDRQVHGPEVRTVEQAAGASPGDCDGLATGTGKLRKVSGGGVVGIRTADCVPVLLWDRAVDAVAAVHAGWRGIAARIPQEGVKALVEGFGAEPARMFAAIGPAIDACCYEVDDATADAVLATAPGMTVVAGKRAGHREIGLRSAVAEQLRGAGVPPTAIETVGGCTSCEVDLFFSHRRDKGRTGRHLSFIAPRGEARR